MQASNERNRRNHGRSLYAMLQIQPQTCDGTREVTNCARRHKPLNTQTERNRQMTTQTEIRNSFWATFPEFKNERRSRKTQNDYRTDIRVTFCDYVEALRSQCEISDALAGKVTL